MAYRYTYNGQVYQVGEFAEDLPPDSTNYIWRWFRRLTDPFLAPDAFITPRAR